MGQVDSKKLLWKTIGNYKYLDFLKDFTQKYNYYWLQILNGMVGSDWLPCSDVLIFLDYYVFRNIFLTLQRRQIPILNYDNFHQYSDDRHNLYKKMFCSSIRGDMHIWLLS